MKKLGQALVFPPVNNYRRFLIHKTVEETFKNLKTFSIGEAEDRRTVVCYEKDYHVSCELLSKQQQQQQPLVATNNISGCCRQKQLPDSEPRSKRSRTMPSVGIYRPPAARKLEEEENRAARTPRTTTATTRVAVDEQSRYIINDVVKKQRKPDQAIYIPRGRRLAEEKNQNCDKSVRVGEEEEDSRLPPIDKLELTIEKLKEDDVETAQSHEDDDDDNWERLFDDSDDRLGPILMKQLSGALGEVNVDKPKSDYGCYKNNRHCDVIGDELGHVVEFYNFPPEFKTQDLLTIFSQFKNGGFDVMWVDDTHALGIFSSSLVASEVLEFEHPFVKTRPLKDGTPSSKAKARKCSESLQPYRSRPDTCAALARRLVTGALGVKLPNSREEREAEKKLLKEAREKKKLAAKQMEEAWEGTFTKETKN